MAALGSYPRLFRAKAVGLAASGLSVIALALVAFNVAGEDAGAVLGTALAMKALGAFLAPFAFAALAGRASPGPLLLAADAGRAASVAALAFATAAWQILALAAVFSVAAGLHKVAYDAAAATLLPEEDGFARALSKSRVLDETEGLFTALLATLLVLVAAPAGILAVAAAGFALAAAMAARAVPRRGVAGAADARGRLRALFGAIGTVLRTPALRPAPLLMVSAAAAAAVAAVNTVVIVQGEMALGERETTIALAVFGGGSAAGAFAAPGLVKRAGLRATVTAGALLVPACLLAGALASAYGTLLVLWLLLGAAHTLVQPPLFSLVRRHARPGNVGVMFAAGHVLWQLALVAANALAGWAGAVAGGGAAFALLALLAGGAAASAGLAWPAASTLERKTAP